MSKKKRSLEDTYETTLPEVVVMPRGNYIQYNGNETVKPSYKEYEDAEINKTRVQAVHKMLNLNAPLVPSLPNMNPISRLFGKLGMSDDTRKFVFGKDKNGATCIYTVTSQYDDTDAVISGNKTFNKNPKKYGFVKIPLNKSNIGDLIQFTDNTIFDTPHHGTMVTGLDKNGQPVLTYSNGERDAYGEVYDDNGRFIGYDSNIKKDKELDWVVSENVGTPHAYRYVGTANKKKHLVKQYKKLYN